MEKLGKELIFISRIERDGSGTEQNLSEKHIELIANDSFKLTCLSLTQKTFIASNFNSYVVKLKDIPPSVPNIEYSLKDIYDAVQYGFNYRVQCQNDGIKVPKGNILQWLMFQKNLLQVPEEFEKINENENT